MKIKKLLTSMSGVSLIEMTIVLALIGVAGVGVMKLTENSGKATQNIKNIDDITQLKNQIADILRNPNNCEASLGGRTANSSVPILYQVINGTASPRYSVEAVPANPNKVSIESMQILNLDPNGTNGSGAIANLRIGFRKQAAGSVGGKVLNKDISINANLCRKDFITIASTAAISTLMSQCAGAQKRLIDGPHTFGTIKWAVCQDCTDALTANIINSCQSQGSGGGVDVGSLSELTCATQGGVWDTDSSSCNMDDNSAAASCVSLGGTYTAPNCLFGGYTLQELIDSKIDPVEATIAAMPGSLVNSSTTTCPAGSIYSLSVVGGKIQMNCTPPPACTSCNNWSGWSLYDKGCSSGHGGVEDCRTTCRYVRSCANKLPAGCVGSISNEYSAFWTYLHSMGGGKYTKCDNADEGACPAASAFGL